MTHRPDSVFPPAPRSDAPRTAADLFVDCLENEGVEFVFGIPGEETLDLSEALDRSQLITFVPTRHEQGAAFMADAYGRLTGRPGVCLATLGPGASNLATGVGDATLDHAPLVALTGQTGLAGMHKETTHQFIDTVEMLRPMTKWNTRIHHPRMVPEAVRKAFSIAAAEKPGATHLELPEDVMETAVTGSPLPRGPEPMVEADPVSLLRAAEVIQGAKRPVLLVGNGVVRQQAAAALRAFCEQTGLHVITTFMGKGVLDASDPHFLFTAGLRRQDYPQGLLGRADLVVSVGYDMIEWPPSAWNPDGRQRIVCIDTVPPEIDAHFIPEVELIGDLSRILFQLTASSRARRWRASRSGRTGAPSAACSTPAPTRTSRSSRSACCATCASCSRRRTCSSATSARTSSGWRASGRRASPTPCSSATGSPPWASACRRRSPRRWRAAAAARSSASAATAAS